MSGICVIGDVNVDIVSLLREQLQSNSDTQTSNSLNLGGSPCNMAMWLAHIDAQVTFMAAIGDDLLGDWIKTELTSGGLVTDHIQEVDGKSSGTCIILVGVDGQRTMLPDPGANLDFTLTANELEVIQTSSVVIMSAYSFLRPETRDSALAVVEVIKNCATRLVIDAASSAPIKEVGVDAVRQYLANADLVLANEDEFEVLSQRDWNESLTDIVVKQGANGAKWLRYGEVDCQVPAANVEVVDTTGAGDSFMAGLISVLADHQDWYALDTSDRQVALNRATQVAAMNVATVGAGPTYL